MVGTTIDRRALLAMLAAAPMIAAAPADADLAVQLRALLDRTVKADGPGAVVLAARGNQVLFREARGMASIELGVPLAADQVFEIASITKTFTAATVLKLAEQGRLSLDDPLTRFIPDFPNAAGISIHRLLDHTAGVSDVVRETRPGFNRADLDLKTRIAELASRTPDFAPGEDWRYSNGGYLLLGAVIEAVTGVAWYEAVQAQLLTPLGLNHIGYGEATRIIPGRVSGYSTGGGALAAGGFISMTGPASAGGLVSTADDLRRWMRALSRGQVLSPANLALMTTPTPKSLAAPFQYGLGLYLWTVRGRRLIGHTGQIPGFASAVGHLPEADVTLVVLANDDAFNARGFLRRMAGVALGEPYVDVAATARPVPAADQALLAGAYQEDARTVRTLLIRDGDLYARKGERPPLKLVMAPNGDLHFTIDELSFFRPVLDRKGRVVRLDYYWDGDGPPRPMPRIPS